MNKTSLVPAPWVKLFIIMLDIFLQGPCIYNQEHHQENPSISTGDEGFSDEFYSDLFEIAGQIILSFDATVIGYGDGYYNCSYELNPDGWCGYCDYYENED